MIFKKIYNRPSLKMKALLSDYPQVALVAKKLSEQVDSTLLIEELAANQSRLTQLLDSVKLNVTPTININYTIISGLSYSSITITFSESLPNSRKESESEIIPQQEIPFSVIISTEAMRIFGLSTLVVREKDRFKATNHGLYEHVFSTDGTELVGWIDEHGDRFGGPKEEYINKLHSNQRLSQMVGIGFYYIH